MAGEFAALHNAFERVEPFCGREGRVKTFKAVCHYCHYSSYGYD